MPGVFILSRRRLGVKDIRAFRIRGKVEKEWEDEGNDKNCRGR